MITIIYHAARDIILKFCCDRHECEHKITGDVQRNMQSNIDCACAKHVNLWLAFDCLLCIAQIMLS